MTDTPTDKTDTQYGYKVVRINTTRFSFTDMDEEKANALFESEGRVQMNLSVSINFDSEKSQISFDIKTEVLSLETKKEIVRHAGRTVYAVQNLEKAFDKEKEQFFLPDALMVQLYAIAFSHNRALLAVELNGTVFREKIMLPIIDPSGILDLK